MPCLSWSFKDATRLVRFKLRLASTARVHWQLTHGLHRVLTHPQSIDTHGALASCRPFPRSVFGAYMGQIHIHPFRPDTVTNSSAGIVWAADNTAFGRTINTNSIMLNVAFPGQYYDAESGLYYNGARYYDPTIGRYLQSDPIGLAGGMNTYAYVGGNPILFVDPTGTSWAGVASGEFGMVAGGAALLAVALSPPGLTVIAVIGLVGGGATMFGSLLQIIDSMPPPTNQPSNNPGTPGCGS